MARFFSRNRSILKYLATLNKEKSFTERLTASNEVVQREEDNEEKKRDLGLFTKEEDIKIEDSATVTTLLSNVAASGVTSKDAIVNLPSSGLTAGDASIVFIDSNTAKYYISNGEGWYNAGFANTDPTWFSQPNPSYALDSTAPLTIEPIAVDSGGKIFSYSATLDNDASQFLTITKDSADGRIFTITGDSAGAVSNQNSGVVTWRVSDGIGLLTYDTTITLDYISTGTLTRSHSSRNEGQSVTFTLPVTGYSDGDTFPYTITGIQAADLNPQTLTGDMVVSGSNATKTISIRNDLTTEGTQTMTFSADGQSVSVSINDTSRAPTYTLTTSHTSRNEGQSFTVTLSTTGVATGTRVAYTITGVSRSDINNAPVNATGADFTVGSNGSASKTFTVTADATTEGTETFRLRLNGSETGFPAVNVTINDTSASSQARWWLKANSTSFAAQNISSYGPFSALITSDQQTHITNNWIQIGSYYGPGGTLSKPPNFHVIGTTNFNYRTNGTTVEAWMYFTGSPDGYWDTAAYFTGDTDTTNYRHVYWITSATGTAIGAGNTWGYHSFSYGHNSWRHYAWVWDTNGHHKLFVNGTEQNIPYPTYVSPGTYLEFRLMSYNGYVQDVRVSNYNRYTANFTAPTRGSNNL